MVMALWNGSNRVCLSLFVFDEELHKSQDGKAMTEILNAVQILFKRHPTQFLLAFVTVVTHQVLLSHCELTLLESKLNQALLSDLNTLGTPAAANNHLPTDTLIIIEANRLFNCRELQLF